MVIPIEWFKKYIDVSESPEEVAEAFTSIGYMLDKPIDNEGEAAVLDLEVRQNRPDCLSLIGLAREYGTIKNRQLRMPDMAESIDDVSGETSVEIPNPDLCPRFFAVTFENVKVGESPDWLKRDLELYGIKSINALVDITNYVTVELGMPMHAYDADAVKDRKIIIRNAEKGESLTLFGGRKITFAEDDIIHADPDGPIGFGALMGGEEKSVRESTTSVILEAAVYNQASVRRSSRRHALRTEASTRLEKFLHPELVGHAMRRAVYLIRDIVGGTITDTTDAYPLSAETHEARLTKHQLHRLSGMDISMNEAEETLTKLGFETISASDEEIAVRVPYFRTDVEQEEDLIEEVVRIHGYDAIPEKLPSTEAPRDIQSTLYDLEEQARDCMVSLGYDEVITDPLTDISDTDKKPVLLQNSLSSEKSQLRTSLQHSLEYALSNRQKYRQDPAYASRDIRLFEVGKLYYMDNQEYKEERVLAGIVHGKDAHDRIKGDVEVVFERLEYLRDDSVFQVRFPDKHTAFFSINLDALIRLEQSKAVLLSSPPQLIFHDISLEISPDASIDDLFRRIRACDQRIYHVSLKDDAEIDGRRKILISAAYSDPDAPMSEADADPIRGKIIGMLSQNDI